MESREERIMTQLPLNDEEIKQQKQKEFWEKARKGVLKYLADQGGKLDMGKLHEYSATKYFIQHQRFSEMMESFVNEGLAEHDFSSGQTCITELGQKFIA